MADRAHELLRNARDERNLTRLQVSQTMRYALIDTVRRWETGEVVPTPDDVRSFEKAIGAENEMLWHRWMREKWGSYREYHPATTAHGLLESAVTVKYELQDVLDLHERFERDAVDGRIDDQKLKADYLKELDEAQAAIIQMRGKIFSGR